MSFVRHSLSVALCLAVSAGSPALADYTLQTLVSFNGTNGSSPEAGLIADASGNLYGTTISGGANNDGTVFEIAAGTHALTTLHSFTGADGERLRTWRYLVVNGVSRGAIWEMSG